MSNPQHTCDTEHMWARLIDHVRSTNEDARAFDDALQELHVADPLSLEQRVQCMDAFLACGETRLSNAREDIARSLNILACIECPNLRTEVAILRSRGVLKREKGTAPWCAHPGGAMLRAINLQISDASSKQ